MRNRKILSVTLIITMLMSLCGGLVSANTAVYEIDFTTKTPGSTVEGMSFMYIPKSGNVSYEIPEGKQTARLCINDTNSDGNNGPKIMHDFPTIRSNSTVHTKFTVANMCRYDFVPKAGTASYSEGVRFYYTNAGAVYIDNTAADDSNYVLVGETLTIPAGEDVELWIYFDFIRHTADVCFTSASVARYSGKLGENVIKSGEYIILKDMPVTIGSVGRAMFASVMGTGKSYIEFIRLYNGNTMPVSVASLDNTEAVRTASEEIRPFKAPWILRSDSMQAYLTGIAPGALTRFSSNRVIPTSEKPDYSEYMPDMSVVNSNLERYRGVHPRVPYEQSEWDAFIEKMKDPAYEEVYKQITENTSQLNAKIGLSETASTVEQQYRPMGYAMAWLSFAYKATNDEKYINKAIEWAQFGCTLGQIGKDNLSLAAGQFLQGMALVYDYGYDKLSDDLKLKMRNKMLEQGRIVYNAMVNPVYTGTWPGTNYLGNFSMVILTGLNYAAYALYDEEPEVIDWLPEIMKHYALIYALSSDDGASIEGTNYWSFGYPFLFEGAELSRKMWGLDPMEKSSWMKNAAYYRFYLAYPRNSWTRTSHVMMTGDAYEYDAGSIDYIFYMMADRFDMPFMQWLGNEMQERVGRNSRFTPFFYNAYAEEKSPEELNMPTLHYFDDLDIISARSDWSGDESMILFNCGSKLGKKASRYVLAFPENPYLGEAHAHPDANHFNLFGYGGLLLRDDGYVYKQTNSHNTLLINGAGQKYEGKQYYNVTSQRDITNYYEIPYIKTVVSTEDYDYFVGCGANAYPLSSGLEKFNRHMLYLKKEDVLIVADDVKALESSNFELRFFPENEIVSELDGAFIAQGPTNTLCVENLTPDETTLSIDNAEVYYAQSSTLKREAKVFSVKKTSDKMLSVTALSWSDAKSAPKRVKAERNKNVIVFTVGDKKYTMNISTSAVSAEASSGEQAKPSLSGVVINSIPIAFEDDKLDYEFNLDDYYLQAGTKTVNMTPVLAEGISSAEVSVDMPDTLPGEAKITVTCGNAEKTYSIKINKTNYSVKKIPLSTAKGKTVDNDLNTFFKPTEKTNFSDYDMGELKEVCGIEIAWQNSTNGFANYRIEYSTDGTDFIPLCSGKSSGRATTLEYVEFEAPIQARVIRLCLDGNDSKNFYHGVCEFAAFEKE